MVTVDEFMDALDHPRKDEIELLRVIIRESDPSVREGVKWNAPSFAVDDWFATLTLRPTGPLRVVLHTGAKARPGHPDVVIDDPQGLLVWQGAAHDRAVVTFADADDIAAKRDAFTGVLRQWIPQLPGPA